MRVLALDTTTRIGSVALFEDDHLIEERAGDPARTHAERLPRDLAAILEDHGLGFSSLDVFAVAAGPGSFTGLRIGIATVQALAYVTGRRLFGVSALEALAQQMAQHAGAGALVGAWIDAHRREVFSALYLVEEALPFTPERLKTIEGPVVGEPVDTMARWTAWRAGRPMIMGGDGAALYAEIAGWGPAAGVDILEPPLLAGAVARLATLRARAGEPGDPSAVRPLYVRRPDAELDREKRRVAR